MPFLASVATAASLKLITDALSELTILLFTHCQIRIAQPVRFIWGENRLVGDAVHTGLNMALHDFPASSL